MGSAFETFAVSLPMVKNGTKIEKYHMPDVRKMVR
jgi:hypothetical protein